MQITAGMVLIIKAYIGVVVGPNDNKYGAQSNKRGMILHVVMGSRMRDTAGCDRLVDM